MGLEHGFPTGDRTPRAEHIQNMQLALLSVSDHLSNAPHLVARADDTSYVFANHMKHMPGSASAMLAALASPERLAGAQADWEKEFRDRHERSLRCAWFDVVYFGKPSAIMHARDAIDTLIDFHYGYRLPRDLTTDLETQMELEVWKSTTPNFPANTMYRFAADTCYFNQPNIEGLMAALANYK